jgi:integrase
MAQRLIKIELSKYNCRGIYFEDSRNLFSKNEIITKDEQIKKIEIPFKLILRTTVIHRGKTITSKKTFPFDDPKITFKKAIGHVSSERENFRENVSEIRKAAPKQKKQTLREAWDQYILSREDSQSLSAENIYNQKCLFDKHIKGIEHLPVNEIENNDIQKIVNTMLKSGLSPRTAKGIQDYLRPFFKSMKIIPNPAQDIMIPTFDNTVNFELDEEMTKKFIHELKSYQEPTIMGIFSFLMDGRRLGEVLKMEWLSVDIKSSTYSVQSLTTKNRKTVQYELREETIEVLNSIPKISTYIFPAFTNTSKPMSRDSFRTHWSKILKDLELKMRIHDIRHLIGGILVNNGATLEEIAAVLGHSSTAVTKRYSKVKKETASKAIKIFH